MEIKNLSQLKKQSKKVINSLSENIILDQNMMDRSENRM